jgi:very-short-patch-repair endonuclease
VSAAAESGFVLMPDQLRGVGLTRQTARTLVRRGTWTRAAYGAVAPIDVADDDPYLVVRRRHALAAAAAARRRPGHVVSGRSAAVLHGLPTFEVPDRPELTAPHSVGLGPRGFAHVRGAALLPSDVTWWFGIPVTTVARTLVDLARHDRRDGLMAADAARHERLVVARPVEFALARAQGWPGVRQAREVLVLASALAESPLESLVRLMLYDDGIPLPTLQARIPGSAYRVDMLWREQRLILEVDGLRKYTGEELRREKRRERRLRRLGYRVERVTWDDIIRFWPATRQWLRAALGLPA